MSSFGKLFIASVLADGRTSALLQHGPIEHLFKAHETELFEFVKEFVKQFHKLPHPDTVLAHTGAELPEAKEGPDYYLELLKARHIELELKKAMKAAADRLTADNKDPAGALQAVVEAVMPLVLGREAHQIVDFRHAYGLVMGHYNSHWNGQDEDTVKLGWPSLDDMTGGLSRGDLLSFVGRPAKGKTQSMLYAAHSPWRREGRRVLFVSMEMPILQIAQRLAAMQTELPMTWIKKSELTSSALITLKDGLTAVQGAKEPFWIVDGNFTATVEDVWALARQLKPDAIFVDGAYLLRHPKERDRYKRVAENADLLKQLLAELAPTICSWQFAKSAAKKKPTFKGEVAKADPVGLEDIGYTDAIAQVSSLVLGIFEEDSVEVTKRRRIEVLKGRNGEVASFLTHWNWHAMKFDEIKPELVETLQF